MAVTMEKTKTPGVYKRGGRYVATWRHRGKQHKSFHGTYAEAREAKAQRTAGDKRPAAKVRFGSYFAEWIETYAGRTARGFSETTRPEYRRSIADHALRRWEGWKLAEIRPGHVRELFGAMRKDGATTSQIKKVRAALSAMLATAVDDGLIDSNPVAGVRIPASRDDEPADEKSKALTRAELAILLAAIPDEWHLFFEFLAHTGLRISEAVGLRWEHLQLTAEQPRVEIREQLYKGVRKKLKSTSGRRDVPLSPGMSARLLAQRRDAYRGPKSPVFTTTTGTELLPANVYRRVLAPAAIAVGFSVEVTGEDGKPRPRSTVSFHTFRHTCASLLFDQGKNPKQVQRWLGHATAAFTLDNYVHLMDDGLGDAGFLDEQVGNARATEGPQSTGKDEAPVLAYSAV